MAQTPDEWLLDQFDRWDRDMFLHMSEYEGDSVEHARPMLEVMSDLGIAHDLSRCTRCSGEVIVLEPRIL